MSKRKYKILFVCTGNSCRSPMAEGILRDYLKRNKIENFEVASAGIMAPSGLPASNYSLMVSVENGIDLSSHRSQLIDRDLIESSDLILVMEESHKKFIAKFFPFSKDRVYLLKNFGENAKGGEVADPMGYELEIYRRCYKELKKEIYRIILELIKISEEE
ncbi:MAG: low molecular weight protein arginine phosphatase [bacterium]